MNTLLILIDFYGHPALTTDDTSDTIRYSHLTKIISSSRIEKDKFTIFTTPIFHKDHRLEELKRMEVGAWFSEEFRGEEFPTLKNSLELMKDKIAVNIEIKTEAVSDETEGGVVDKALQVVKDLDMTSSVIFSSFDYRVMEQLNVLDPKMAKALLYEASQSAELLPSELVQKYKVDIFNCSYKQLSKEWINDLQKHKIPYFVYTVNEPELMRELIEKGVSGIFTDFPKELIRIVENM